MSFRIIGKESIFILKKVKRKGDCISNNSKPGIFHVLTSTSGTTDYIFGTYSSIFVNIWAEDRVK